MEGTSELLSDINGSIASPLKVDFGRHTFDPAVLDFKVDLILRKAIKTSVNLALTQINSPACYFALLYTSVEITYAFQVVFPLPSESFLFPDKGRRLLLGFRHLGNASISGGSGFDLMFKARRYREVVLTGVMARGYVPGPTDARSPTQRVRARDGWTIARRTKHVVAQRRL